MERKTCLEIWGKIEWWILCSWSWFKAEVCIRNSATEWSPVKPERGREISTYCFLKIDTFQLKQEVCDTLLRNNIPESLFWHIMQYIWCYHFWQVRDPYKPSQYSLVGHKRFLRRSASRYCQLFHLVCYPEKQTLYPACLLLSLYLPVVNIIPKSLFGEWRGGSYG